MSLSTQTRQHLNNKIRIHPCTTELNLKCYIYILRQPLPIFSLLASTDSYTDEDNTSELLPYSLAFVKMWFEQSPIFFIKVSFQFFHLRDLTWNILCSFWQPFNSSVQNNFVSFCYQLTTEEKIWYFGKFKWSFYSPPWHQPKML